MGILIPTNEVIFSCKFFQITYRISPFEFNNNNITRCSHQTHLEVVLDSNLNFNTPFNHEIKKCSKIIDFIRRISVNLPRNALLKYLS